MTDDFDWKKYLDNPNYEIRVGYVVEPFPNSHNHYSDVIVYCGGEIPVYISINEWKEKQEYDRLKRKWSWLD